MEFEIVSTEQVPRVTKPPAKATQDILDMLAAIPKGSAAKITPEEGKSVKGVRIGISRIISNRKLSGYSVSADDQFVYVTRDKR